MSIILDALRKLEEKRRPETALEILSGGNRPGSRRGRGRVWPWILSAVLVVNALLLLVWITGGGGGGGEREGWGGSPGPALPAAAVPDPAVSDRSPAPVPSPSTVPTRLEKAPSAAPGEKGPLPLPRKGAAEAPLPGDRTVAEETVAEETVAEETVAEETAPEETAPEETAPEETIAEETAPGGEAASVPGAVPGRIYSFDDLPAEVRRELGELRISAHVFSDDRSLRIIGIGGGLRREGDSIRPGLRLEEITEKAALFSYGGYRFTLPGY